MSDARLLAGRYHLESVLGRGGMGQVWLGRDETLGRTVAVKEIRLPTALSDEDRDALCSRMLREARLTARLSHPGVVTVYDVVSEDGRPFIVMELLQVPTMADEVAKTGPMGPQRVAEIGLELLPALEAAHRAGIVHRDVKPSNVLLSENRVVLSDFGIATSDSDPRLTATGLIVGSPTYMSPERLRGDATGPETDMWSLGATLYAAVEGRPPFDGATTMGTVLSILNDDLPRPAVSGELGEVLTGLLDKDPGRRLDSRQAARLLRRVVNASPAAATAVPVPVAAPRDDDAAAPIAASTGVIRTSGDDERPIWQSEPELEDPQDSAAYEPPDEELPAAVDERPPGRRPGTRTLLLALLVLTVVVAGALGARMLAVDDAESSGDDPGEAATTEAPRSEPSAADPTSEPVKPKKSERPSKTPKADVPASFRLQDDPLDFEVAVPDGWQRRLDGTTRVDYVDPNSSAYVRIDQQPEAGPSAEQAWRDSEAAVSARLPGYERIKIEQVDYRSWDTADWEFTWSGDNGTVHVLNRGIATDTKGFALYVSAPDSRWRSVGKPAFDTAAETFTPTD